MNKTLVGALALFILLVLTNISAKSQANRFYQSRANGNWSGTGSWQSSANATTGFTNTTVIPTAASLTIKVRNGHTITINAALTIDEVIVESGGILNIAANTTISQFIVQSGGTVRWTNGSLSIAIAAGDDLSISGTFQDERTADILPAPATGATIKVQTGGMIRVMQNFAVKDGYASDENTSLKNFITWENGSIFNWSINAPFSTADVTYFPNAGVNTVPIFRYTSSNNLTVGATTFTTINGVFEVSTNGTRVVWNNSGVKTFRNGLIGLGSIRQNVNAGKFSLTGPAATITIDDLELESSAGLVIENGCTTTLISTPTSNNVDYDAANGGEITVASGGIFDISTNWNEINGNIEVLNGGTLDCRASVLASDPGATTATIIVQAWGTFISAHANGVNGNIPAAGINRDLKTASSYTFDGAVSQTTGTFMPTSIGNLIVANTGAVNNFTVTVSNTTALTVQGNLTITDGQLTLNSNVAADLNLHGNFTRYFSEGIFNENGRSISFVGTTNSIISTPPPPPAGGSATQQDFGRAFVNKTGTAKVILNTNTGITSLLTLTNGIIDARSYPLYIKNEQADNASNGIVSGSINSYVDGVLFRYMSPTATGAYSFPIGKSDAGPSGKYKPITFNTTAVASPGSLFRAEYFNGNNVTPEAGTQESFLGSSLTGILKDEFWQFDKVQGAASTKGKLTITYENPGNGFWRDADGNTNLNPCSECNVAIVKRSTDNGAGTWNFTKADYMFDVTSATPEARLYSQNGTLQTGELSTFSPFTMGYGFNTILGGNTLPVKLLNFNGSAKGTEALLNWTIDSDKDLSRFELEHSSNGQVFSVVKNVQAKGIRYDNVQAKLLVGKNYFRLKVAEKTGNTYYSKVILLVGNAAANTIVSLQSTQVQQQLKGFVQSAKSQQAEISIVDMSGKRMMNRQMTLQAGSNEFSLPVHLFTSGVYLLVIHSADGQQQSVRWLKE